ncbi:hypothetical protein GM415_03755 [Pseudodesulfovibrio cashew]|uniref:Uncharacterized protein n=1 Tax=Pseudodesulfovibrio cashew TaxID=2678688 RepID=A0A6I6JDW5_9BACT|nr:hypothetical protein [Pseudodesulfovibrio cashew]QGY39270.1 hypothetical protein GM415_03755 [Pseudodesulfovibrio cashew]
MLLEPIDISGSFDTRVSARGYCARCKREHTMVVGYAGRFADRLLHTLTEKGRIDLEVPDGEADPRFSTDYLYGEARGQMFGVLVVRGMDGRPGLLKAFSGQYNGVWEVDGWVPPLVDMDRFHAVNTGVERFIKRLGRQIDEAPAGSPEREALVARRRAVSRALMRDIHNLYMIPNLCGELISLREAVVGQGGIPTGMGDCCGPKLLGYAARHSLTPLGLAEFYVGRENRSGTRRHGGMYAACHEKCARIMGYMLCEECGA